MKALIVCTGRGQHEHLQLAIVGPDEVEWIDRCRVGDFVELAGAMLVREVAVKAPVALGDVPRFAPLTQSRAQDDRGDSSGEIVYLRARDAAVGRFRCPHCQPVEMTEEALRRCAAMPAGYSMLGPLDASMYAVAGRRYLDRVEEIASRGAARFPDS